MTFEESEKLWESIEMVKDVLMSSDQVIEKLPPDKAQFITAYNTMLTKAWGNLLDLYQEYATQNLTTH